MKELAGPGRRGWPLGWDWPAWLVLWGTSARRPGGRCVGGLGENGGVGMDTVERRVETRGDWRNFAVNTSGNLWLPESKEWVLEDVFCSWETPECICVQRGRNWCSKGVCLHSELGVIRLWGFWACIGNHLWLCWHRATLQLPQAEEVETLIRQCCPPSAQRRPGDGGQGS